MNTPFLSKIFSRQMNKKNLFFWENLNVMPKQASVDTKWRWRGDGQHKCWIKTCTKNPSAGRCSSSWRHWRVFRCRNNFRILVHGWQKTTPEMSGGITTEELTTKTKYDDCERGKKTPNIKFKMATWLLFLTRYEWIDCACACEWDLILTSKHILRKIIHKIFYSLEIGQLWVNFNFQSVCLEC